MLNKFSGTDHFSPFHSPLEKQFMQQSLSIKEIVSRLESRGYSVKRSGKTYRSQCPAHDGDRLNLAFSEGNKGQVVFTCHSHGCKYEEIMASLGIEKETQPVKKQTKTLLSLGVIIWQFLILPIAFHAMQSNVIDELHGRVIVTTCK